MQIYIYNQNCTGAGNEATVQSGDTTTFEGKDIPSLKRIYLREIKNSNDLFEVKRARTALEALGVEIRNIRSW